MLRWNSTLNKPAAIGGLSKKTLCRMCTLDRPVIEGPDFERESKFWCYFCTEEISKHLVLDVCVLKFGGLLEHIACLEHKKKMYGFFYDNRVDETQRHPDLFFLQTEQHNRFKELAEKHIQQYETVKRKEISLYKTQLCTKDHQQQQAIQMDAGKSEIISRGSAHFPTMLQSNVAMTEKKATYIAKGEGLTFIGAHDYKEGEGNIYTGTTPPWLLGERESGYGGQIGPTAEAFNKHKEQEKKKKLLPATRVGAGFDRKSQAGEQWLPSFGRVWNKGRRLQSKQYFERQFFGSTKKPRVSETVPSHTKTHHDSTEKDIFRKHSHFDSTMGFSVTPLPSAPKYVKPYVKKTDVSVTKSVPPPCKHSSTTIFPEQIPLLLPTPVLKAKTKRTCTVTTVNGQTIPYTDNKSQDNSGEHPKYLPRLDSDTSPLNTSVVGTTRNYCTHSAENYSETISYTTSEILNVKPYSRKRKLQHSSHVE